MRTLLLSLVLILAPQAHALLHVRAHAGFQFIAPDSMNDWLSTQDIKQIYIYPRLGFSALLRPWTMPFSLGVIYDDQSIKVNTSNNGNNFAKVSTKRIAAKFHYHLVDKTWFFTGPVAELGIQHKVNLQGDGHIGAFQYNKAKGRSYLAAWEVGFILKFFTIGWEIGYLHHQYESVEDANGTAAPFTINLSGISILTFAGLAF